MTTGSAKLTPKLASKLALGTVQFGLQYGIANSGGQPATDEVGKILACASNAGVDTLDTAIDYGDSETVLGALGVSGWRIVSKLPALPADTRSVDDWVHAQVKASLQRLNIAKLEGLLLHRPAELVGARGSELMNALGALRNDGLVDKIGVSIYAPDELDQLKALYEEFDLLQAPYNVLDRRLATSGWLEKLHQSGCEVHTRSAFLQGLLLMPASERPDKFRRWQPLWDRWDSWLADNNVNALQSCLNFALANEKVGRVVVGVDSTEQLEQIIMASRSDALPPPENIACKDVELLNPALWGKL